MPADEWFGDRERAYRRMLRDLNIGYLDQGVLDILLKIFSFQDLYPTSSCTGRIVAVDARYPWDRKSSHTFFKKHSEISEQDLAMILRTPAVHTSWVIASGPIVHVMARRPRAAVSLLRIAREAGFKHSGILGSSRRGYLVELVTGIWIGIPLRSGEKILVNDSEMGKIAEILNRALAEGRERLSRLSAALQKLTGGADPGPRAFS